MTTTTHLSELEQLLRVANERADHTAAGLREAYAVIDRLGSAAYADEEWRDDLAHALGSESIATTALLTAAQALTAKVDELQKQLKDAVAYANKPTGGPTREHVAKIYTVALRKLAMAMGVDTQATLRRAADRDPVVAFDILCGAIAPAAVPHELDERVEPDKAADYIARMARDAARWRTMCNLYMDAMHEAVIPDTANNNVVRIDGGA